MTRKRAPNEESSDPTGVPSSSASALTLLRSIKDGTLSPRALTRSSRRICVEHLYGEGASAAEIAEIVKVSERTVFRDLEDIRAANALHRDPELGARIAGEIVQQARQSAARARRIAREKDCPHSVRLEAERASWTIIKEMAVHLGRLGYTDYMEERTVVIE